MLNTTQEMSSSATEQDTFVVVGLTVGLVGFLTFIIVVSILLHRSLQQHRRVIPDMRFANGHVHGL